MTALLLTTHHPHVSVWSIAIFALLLFTLKAAAFDLTDLERTLGDAVRESLLLAGITEEVAASVMGMDVSNLRKCLRGEGRLQLGVAKLLRLPFNFWINFAPQLMYLVAKKNITEIAEDFGLKRNV